MSLSNYWHSLYWNKELNGVSEGVKSLNINSSEYSGGEDKLSSQSESFTTASLSGRSSPKVIYSRDCSVDVDQLPFYPSSNTASQSGKGNLFTLYFWAIFNSFVHV